MPPCYARATLVFTLVLGWIVWLGWLAALAAERIPAPNLTLPPQADQIWLRQVAEPEDDRHLPMAERHPPHITQGTHAIDATTHASASQGTDFWLTFLGNLSRSGLVVLITSDQNTSGTVSLPGLGVTKPFTVSAGSVTPVLLPPTAALNSSDRIENKGIHVTAANEITVYGMNRFPFTTDVYLALPTDMLGTEYLVLGYRNTDVINGTQFAIVATTNATSVTITPAVTTDSRSAGVPYTITLDQGQTYLLRNTDRAPNDLSGTSITSDRPIAVFGGHRCANIPPGFAACDHLVEQLPPVNTWGKNFVAMPLATRLNGDTFRFLAAADGTTVTVNGAAVATLNRGQFHEQIIAEPAQITADRPILVAQYAHGTQFDDVTSDPFMMVVPPFEQFLNHYVVPTPSTGFPINFITVVAPAAAVGTILLDGLAIPADNFVPIGASGLAGVHVPVGGGAHILTGALPFGVSVYGFASSASYGFPGGMSLAAVASVTAVTLTPEAETHPVGTEHCLVAAATDQGGNPVAEVRVDFTVTGANPTMGFASTDASGQAAFCYSGTTLGVDTIVASVGALSDSATKAWVEAIFRSNDGRTVLTVDAGQGTFTLVYIVNEAPQRCSGGAARIDAGLLTISSHCLEDPRDMLRAVGQTDGPVTVQLLDWSGPNASDRTVRQFVLSPP